MQINTYSTAAGRCGFTQTLHENELQMEKGRCMYMCLAEMLAQLMKDAAVVIVAGGLVAAFVAYACCVVGERSERR